MSAHLSQRAANRLFLRIGQAGRAAEAHVDRLTLPLFPLPLIMDAEGVLASDARHLVRRTDPDTSAAAAARVAEFGGKHAAAIFAWLCANNDKGGTKDEISAGTGIDSIAVARRMAGLCAGAGVHDSGERRKSIAGRASIVWKVRR